MDETETKNVAITERERKRENHKNTSFCLAKNELGR